MNLLVIGAGMMGAAAAYDMARCARVDSITLADADLTLATRAADRIDKLTRVRGATRKVKAVRLNASDAKSVQRLMRKHDGALSAVPYFFNFELAKAAVASGCHFADLGGNNTVVRRELGLGKAAAKKGVRIAPDCGLSPGMASILAGELMRRAGGKADALKIYVGGLPQDPQPPFHYQLVFSVEGLINEYAEPARVLRNGQMIDIEPLTEIEKFAIPGFPELEAFHTSGGTSTLPETFAGKVGECFEKTLRYPGHAAMIRTLYDFGLFDKKARRVAGANIAPRAMMADLMVEKFRSSSPDVTVMRVEAHTRSAVHSFTLVDKYDEQSKMTSMMRTTAWPASIVLQMLAAGEIEAKGAIFQERDIPAAQLLAEMAARGIEILYQVSESTSSKPRPKAKAVSTRR